MAKCVAKRKIRERLDKFGKLFFKYSLKVEKGSYDEKNWINCNEKRKNHIKTVPSFKINFYTNQS